MASYTLKTPQIMTSCMIEISRSMGKTVTIAEPKHTDRQRNYYWSIVDVIRGDTGDLKQHLHAQFCADSIGVDWVQTSRGRIAIIKSSADISKTEYAALIDTATQRAMELNIRIPAPSYYGMD